MLELMDALCSPRGENLVAVIVVVFCGGGVLFVLSWGLWLQHRRAEFNAELKRDMLAAGLSVDDILRVLEAGGPRRFGLKKQTRLPPPGGQ
jgi:hypothetical protein